jgi:TolB protein
VALFIAGADGQGARAIVSGKASLAPTVSPDGKSVAFHSNRGGALQIWIVDVDGGSPRALTPGPRNVGPVFSPDGQSIYYSAFEESQRRIMKVPVAGATPVAVRMGGAKAESMPQAIFDISPDGRWIAGPVEFPEAHAIRPTIVSLAGDAPSRTFDFVLNNVKFTPDGRGLSYIDTKGGVPNIWVQPIDGGPPRQITSFTTDRIYTYAWSRDGKSLALCRGNATNDVVLISNLGR